MQLNIKLTLQNIKDYKECVCMIIQGGSQKLLLSPNNSIFSGPPCIYIFRRLPSVSGTGTDNKQ